MTGCPVFNGLIGQRVEEKMYSNKACPSPLRPLAIAVLACVASGALAQSEEKILPSVSIKETKSVAEKYQLPVTTESITAAVLAETVNVVNTECAEIHAERHGAQTAYW